MPELPEVETVRRGLAPVMDGQQIVVAQARRPDLRFPFPDRFAERLTGARIERLDRRAKYLIAPLDTGEALIMHLGMSGRFTIADDETQKPLRALNQDGFAHARLTDPKHDHVVFAMQGGAVVTFNDPRRFGYMDLVSLGSLETCKHLAVLGPEPLSNAFSPAGLGEVLARKTAPIKAALLDQRVVAGLGNIYVCEALHRAQIHPASLSRELVDGQVVALVAAIKDVLTEAIAAGGSSLRDHAQANGAMGYFQHAFAVYGREGAPCRRAGCSGVIVRQVHSNRSTFYCDLCQLAT